MAEPTEPTGASGLLPYNQDRLCEKCGYDDIASSYDAGCGGHRGCDRHPEKIARLCRRCRYTWDEAPLVGSGESGAS